MSQQPSRMTQAGFDLLLSQLDPDRDHAGERYESLRRKLIKFLGWWGCEDGENVADQALDRVAGKLLEGEPVRDLSGYLMGVARLIFKEYVKDQVKLRTTVERIKHSPAPVSYPSHEQVDKGDNHEEVRYECYENCLGQLSSDSRDLVMRYYRIQEGNKASKREALSAELQIPLNLLRVRAFRIRQKLGDCFKNCLKNRA